MLSHLFSMLAAAITPIAGATLAGYIIGGSLLLITALSILWPYIKPMPRSLPANAENWTKEAKENKIDLEGKKETLDQIAHALKMNRHALLVGPSRVGKSLSAKAFAKAVERGDYPELVGKTVFRINTSDLIGQDGKFLGKPILKKISDQMGRHSNNIILVLDEIHMACKDNSKIADQLKTLLDEGGKFPHVIGITTDEEYQHVSENHAFALRFNRINVESSSQTDTLKILNDYVLGLKSPPIIQPDVLRYIYEESSRQEGAVQPHAALLLLKKCIAHTDQVHLTESQKMFSTKSIELDLLRAQAILAKKNNNEIFQQIQRLESELQALCLLCKKNTQEVQNLQKAKEYLNKSTRKYYQTVIKIDRVSKSLNKGISLNEALLTRCFLKSQLENIIQAQSRTLGIQLEITNQLVDQLSH